MAKMPPSRSYRLLSPFFSAAGCLACAYALSAPAIATGAALRASPATALRLVIVETAFAMVTSLECRQNPFRPCRQLQTRLRVHEKLARTLPHEPRRGGSYSVIRSNLCALNF